MLKKFVIYFEDSSDEIDNGIILWEIEGMMQWTYVGSLVFNICYDQSIILYYYYIIFGIRFLRPRIKKDVAWFEAIFFDETRSIYFINRLTKKNILQEVMLSYSR